LQEATRSRRKEAIVDSYILRIYRQEKKNPRMLIGTVEKVGKRGRAAFTNMDELWEIVDEGKDGKAKMRKVKNEPKGVIEVPKVKGLSGLTRRRGAHP
jgi:hypothetical protein